MGVGMGMIDVCDRIIVAGDVYLWPMGLFPKKN
jgi:hypothetical protein